MKFMRRRATLAAAAAAFALPAGRAAAADPVKVGAIFPMSGGAVRKASTSFRPFRSWPP